MTSLRERIFSKSNLPETKTTFKPHTGLLTNLDKATGEPIKGPDQLGVEGYEEAVKIRANQVKALMNLLSN